MWEPFPKSGLPEQEKHVLEKTTPTERGTLCRGSSPRHTQEEVHSQASSSEGMRKKGGKHVSGNTQFKDMEQTFVKTVDRRECPASIQI